MITLNHTYQNDALLQEWLVEYDFASQNNCLVQIFCGVPEENEIKKISTLLMTNLPNAHIIGTTTDGEISLDRVSVEKIIISISTFTDTTIESTHTLYAGDSYKMGKELVSSIDTNDAKVMIVFTTGLVIDGEQFLDGVRTISQGKFTVAGGMAGDNAKFKCTYVSHQDRVINQGAVCVILKGSELHVRNAYQFNWNPVGLPMKVTKSKLNRVYTIDGYRL